MKKPSIAIIACFCAAFPTSRVEAAPPGKGLIHAKQAIGFSVGKKFTFKVTEAISSKTVGTKVVKKAPVPGGIPKFKKGQNVKFTIGKKGEIKGDGFSIPFKADGGTAFVYATVPTAAKPRANVIQVYKNSKNKPIGASMEFFKVSGSGFDTTVNVVSYILE